MNFEFDLYPFFGGGAGGEVDGTKFRLLNLWMVLGFFEENFLRILPHHLLSTALHFLSLSTFVLFFFPQESHNAQILFCACYQRLTKLECGRYIIPEWLVLYCYLLTLEKLLTNLLIAVE